MRFSGLYLISWQHDIDLLMMLLISDLFQCLEFASIVDTEKPQKH